MANKRGREKELRESEKGAGVCDKRSTGDKSRLRPTCEKKTQTEMQKRQKTSQDVHVSFSMYSLCILFAWPLRVLLAFHFGKCQTSKITSKMISFVSKNFRS